MNILFVKYKMNGKRSGDSSIILKTVLNIARWLAGFFALSEEDRVKAGIYKGGVGRSG